MGTTFHENAKMLEQFMASGINQVSDKMHTYVDSIGGCYHWQLLALTFCSAFFRM